MIKIGIEHPNFGDLVDGERALLRGLTNGLRRGRVTILDKLDARSRGEAAAFARNSGILAK